MEALVDTGTFNRIREEDGDTEIRCDCNRCGDTNGHLYYNMRKDVFLCFKCGYRGHGKPDAVPWDMVIKGNTRKTEYKYHVPGKKLENCEGLCKNKAEEYLRSHHIRRVETQRYDLALDGPWLVFPFPKINTDFNGYHVIRNVFRKIWQYPDGNKPLFWSSLWVNEPLCIVESVPNAIRLSRWIRCVALGGKRVRNEDVGIILDDLQRCTKPRLILCLDGDALGDSVGTMSMFWREARERRMKLGVSIVAVRADRDVCDMDDQEVVDTFARSKVRIGT